MEKNNFTKPLHKLCSNDQLRPALQHIYIKDDGYVYATNGHVASRHHLEQFELDEESRRALKGKAIHKTVFAMLLKHEVVQFKEHSMRALVKGSSDIWVTYYYADTTVPDTNFSVNIARPIEQALAANRNTDWPVTVLNPAYIQLAADVLHLNPATRAMVIQSYDKTKPVVMHSGNVLREVVIAMPVMMHNDAATLWQSVK